MYAGSLTTTSRDDTSRGTATYRRVGRGYCQKPVRKFGPFIARLPAHNCQICSVCKWKVLVAAKSAKSLFWLHCSTVRSVLSRFCKA